MSMSAATADPTPYAQAAGHLVLAGWWPLPLPARSKKSPPEGYTGGTGRAPSPDDVNTWLRTQAAGNVAVRLPPDVVGIDVDAYGDKPGAATLAQLEAEHGPLPATVVVTSRHDGASGIRLFRLPDGVDQATFRTGWPGIEILRHGHRYLVAPPSIHPDTGEPYRCFDPTSGEVLATLPTKADLPVLPAVWAAACAKSERPAPTTPRQLVDVGPAPVDEFAPCKAMSAALADVLERFGSGQARHDVATAGALRLTRLADMGHHGGTYALDVLGRTLVAAITDRLPRGEAVREWESIRTSAADRVAETPTPATDKGCCGADSAAARSLAASDRWLAELERVAPTPEAIAAAVAGEEVVVEEDSPTWADLSWVLTGERRDPPPPEWLGTAAGNFLFYSARVNGLFGDPETAKSWIAMCAVSEALQRGERAAYLDVDHNGANEIATRLLALGAPPECVADADLLRVYEPEDARTLLQFVHDMADWLPAVVVVDSLGEIVPMLGLKSVDNDELTRAIRIVLKPLAHEIGACVITIDHLPKSQESRGTGYAIGGIAKKRAIDGSYLSCEAIVAPAPGAVGKIRLTIEKDRHGHVRRASPGKVAGDFILDSSQPGDAINWHVKPMATASDGHFLPTGAMEAVSRYIEGQPNRTAASRQAVVGPLVAAGPFGKHTLERALVCLESEGYLEVAKNGRGKANPVRLIAAYREPVLIP